MGKYSIKELEKLSGIKAHTLRIWEKRYNIFNPDRTDTNIRKYTDDELKKLLNIAILNHHGLKISKIAELSEKEMVKHVADLSNEENENLDIYIDQLSISMIEMDEAKFEKLLSNYILRFGFETTIIDIMYPFLQKIGVLWLSGNIRPVQEHFMSNLIRQKIIVAIDGLDATRNQNAESVVLFLPDNELHEIGLLFFHYLIKAMHFKTYYLGQYVPIHDLKLTVDSLKPDILVTSLSHVKKNETAEAFVKKMSKKFSSSTIVLTGQPFYDLTMKMPDNIVIVKSASELKEYMKSR